MNLDSLKVKGNNLGYAFEYLPIQKCVRLRGHIYSEIIEIYSDHVEYVGGDYDAQCNVNSEQQEYIIGIIEFLKNIENANIFEVIRQWSKERQLNYSDPSKQMLKIVEELGEVSRAIIRHDDIKLIDGLGDLIISITILAQQNYFNIEDCLNAAYQEIKNRQGKLEDGMFIKSEDLDESR